MKKVLFVFLSFLIFSSCKKEEVNQFIVPDYNNDGEYVLQPLPGAFGNVQISIWPSYNSEESKIEIDNRLDFAIGYIIRDLNDQSFVYFSDNYIKKKGSSEKYGTQLPIDEALYIKVVIYKSSVNYGLIALIEGLGLDFWSSINDYKENLMDEYVGQIILEP